MKKLLKKFLTILFFLCLATSPLCLSTPTSANDILRLAVTTSFENSGLAKRLIPHIEKDLQIELHLIVVATGQALRLGKNGDVDAVLVHAPKQEIEFVKQGFATHRTTIMKNDFLFVGTQPVKAKSLENFLKTIHTGEHTFITRGDSSGTHKKEIALWQAAELNPKNFGSWYRSVGAGMGATLNIANALNAITLTDRGTWLSFKNKGEMRVLYEGGKKLENPYSFLPINPVKHPHIKVRLNESLENWLTSQKARRLIDSYRIGGEQLFISNK